MTAAHAALSLPRTKLPASRPSLPNDLPTLRPLGFAQRQGKFPSSVDRVQAASGSAQFIRPDVPPTEDAPPKQRFAAASAQPRPHGRSALEQAAFVTNAKLQDTRNKASVLPRLPAFPSLKLGFLGL